jgi:uncharacterized protein (TIGR03545 family)
MKQWIRWSGLAGFVVISALLVLGWIFAAGPLIKYSIETFGSQAAKAKVEVESVALTFDPFGIEIQGVQVTNSDKPMENLLQFERAVADIDLLPLLLGKGIVNEVALTGLAFSTPRQNSGAIEISAADNDEAAGSNEEDDGSADKEEASSRPQTLPSADELLSREPLLTEQRGKAFKNSFEAIKADSDKALAALPDGKVFAAYEDDFNRITSGRFDSIKDFQQRKKEFEGLKKRIKQDQQAISHAKKVLSQGKKDLQGQWSGLQSAPAEDFNNLKSKYKLDGAGVANLSRLLFGDKVGEWSQEGLYWYEKVRPFLISDEDEEGEQEEGESIRSEGRFIHFATDRPLPDLLIRQVQLALKLNTATGSLGDVDVSVYDITHQQEVIGRPTRIIATGKGLTDIQSLDLNGILDHRQMPGKDAFDLNIKGMVLKNYDVGAMGLKLNRSQINVIARAELVSGEIVANSTVTFSQAQFSSKDKTQVAVEMAKALAKIKHFDIQASAKGELTSPKVSIKSDLDKQLNAAFNQRLKEKQKELEKQLEKKLNDKLLSYAGDYKEQLKAMNLANGSLADKQAKLKQFANSELSSFQDQQKADAKRKLEQERKAQEAKLAEEKRKAKAKAKAAADKKRKQLEKEARDKLKKLF